MLLVLTEYWVVDVDGKRESVGSEGVYEAVLEKEQLQLGLEEGRKVANSKAVEFHMLVFQRLEHLTYDCYVFVCPRVSHELFLEADVDESAVLCVSALHMHLFCFDFLLDTSALLALHDNPLLLLLLRVLHIIIIII